MVPAQQRRQVLAAALSLGAGLVLATLPGQTARGAEAAGSATAGSPAAASGAMTAGNAMGSAPKLKVVTTFTIIADMARNVAGDAAGGG